MSAILFDLPSVGTTSEDGDWVIYPDSFLMEAGDYTQDKGIRLDPEDLRREEDTFSGPIPNLFHHNESFGLTHDLKGLLGETRDVWTSEDGKTFRGTVVIPKLLDDLWSKSGKPKKISTEWDPKTKKFNGVSLCVSEPYIPEASLMSTFAAIREQTYEGSNIIQRMHDLAASSGAICSADNNRKSGGANFQSSEELRAIQEIHDRAVMGGAHCAVMKDQNVQKSGFAGTGTWKVGAARDLALLDDLDSGWDGQEAENSIFGEGDKIPTDARKAFLIYDSSDPDLKGSYKLPFAIRKGGSLKASRSGLRAAAARLPRTDAPEAVLNRARAVVEAYQARFEKASKSSTMSRRKTVDSVAGVMQKVHDRMSRDFPAVCDPNSKAVRFADYTRQQKAAQGIHDLCVEDGGASCSGWQVKKSAMSDNPHHSRKGGKPVDEKEIQDPEVSKEPDPKAVSFADSPQYKEMQAEILRLKKLAEDRAEEELKSRAAMFASRLVTGDPSKQFLPRITPAAAEVVAALFAQAIRDDNREKATVTFSVGTQQVQGGRVEALEALFSALPGHRLLESTIAPSGSLDTSRFSVYEGPTRSHDQDDSEVLNRMRLAVGLPVSNGTSK